MTITEKIIAYHSKRKKINPGEIVLPKVSLALSNDVTSPIAIEQFKKVSGRLFDTKKIVIVLDHFTPNKDIASAQQCKLIRDFAKKYKIKHFYDAGKVGIEHALLPEEGLVLPGDLVVGADSHTTTYGALGCFSTGIGSTDLAFAWATGKIWLKVPQSIKVIYEGKLNKYVCGKDLILYLIGLIGTSGANYMSLEFTGSTIKKLKMNDRFTICNMAVEAGAKNGIIESDEITFKYVNSKRKYESRKIFGLSRNRIFKSDKNAKYKQIIEIETEKIQPLVALPHSPSNIKPVKEVNNIYIDQVVIGSCTNGWYEDLYRAAKILAGKKINPNIRLIIIPSTPRIYKMALKNGLIDIFINAGGIVSPPTCGPCLGGHMGILADGERCLATTNRNFLGRMGSLKSEVYLSNAYVAAASAIKGKISHPDEI